MFYSSLEEMPVMRIIYQMLRRAFKYLSFQNLQKPVIPYTASNSASAIKKAINAAASRSFLLILFSAFLLFSCSRGEYRTIRGNALGTFYTITYLDAKNRDLQPEAEKILSEIESSLSTYDENSLISRINRNDTGVVPDKYFVKVFAKAKEISGKSGGAFDMTVAPLVNAWGFGFTDASEIDSSYVDSILKYVGYEKVSLKNQGIEKQYPEIMLDASAIAKGYAVDVVFEHLLALGIEHVMVEIGGEVRAAGKNPRGISWNIGIDKPVDDSTGIHSELIEIIMLDNKAIATSGNYRQFYIKDGVKYAHTINPATGYPVQHSLLSASVVADDCMTADAWATAFMVMGLEKSRQLVKNHPELEAYFVYAGKAGEYKLFYTKGFKDYIKGRTFFR